MEKRKKNSTGKGKMQTRKRTTRKQKKTNKRNKGKQYKKRKSFKNRMSKQKGGNLEIILPVAGVVLAAATAGGVYASRKKSNRNRNNESDNNPRIEKKQQNENIDPQTEIEASVFINEILIENFMLDKLQEKYGQQGTDNIPIEKILLEPEQTKEKKYGSLHALAKEKQRTVSGYVKNYISNFFYSYFLFCLIKTDNPNIEFLDFFDNSLKESFISQLADIEKTDNRLEEEFQIPDNIESIFNKAQSQIIKIISFIKDKNDIDVQELIKLAEEYYIKQYGNDYALNKYRDNNIDLSSPENFYSEIINKYKMIR